MLAAFAERAISGLVFSALVAGIVTYFGRAYIFDPLILIAFIAIAVFFRRNIDLLSICSIFIAERALEELMWRSIDYSIWFKIPSYLIFVVVIGFLCKGAMRLFFLSFFTVGVAIEFYWHYTEYNAPMLLWNFYLLAVAIVIRKFLRMRTFWLIELNPKWSPRPIALDTQMLLANVGFITLHCLVIAEYWLRHLTPFKDVVFFHSSFAYVTHSLSMFMIYMLVIQSINHLRELELSA